MSFAAEPYGVFVDDLVSSLTGGVTRERFVFLDEQKPFQLAYAAAAVASTVRVSGIVNGDYFRFTAGTDFDVVAGTIVWRESAPDVPAARATWPDRGSDFYASYERTPDPQAPPRLTDRNPGSIVRTLGESFAREYAVISRQLDLVYQAGFLATASGRDLDEVVSLVGITRWTRSVASGQVVFARSTPAPADIFVPAGTLVSTGQPPQITVETTDAETLRSGTLSATAPVRARSSGPAGIAAAGTLTVINRPILGVDSVTNPQALVFGGADETDAALRARAGRALEAGGGATTDAILGALTSVEGIREQDVRIVEDPVASPGLLKISIASQLDDAHAALAAAVIEQQRPAGIRVHHNLNVPAVSSLAPTSDSQGEDPGPPPAGQASTDPVWFDFARQRGGHPRVGGAHRAAEDGPHLGGLRRDHRVRRLARRRRHGRLQPARRGDRRRRGRVRRVARHLPACRRDERTEEPAAAAAGHAAASAGREPRRPPARRARRARRLR